MPDEMEKVDIPVPLKMGPTQLNRVRREMLLSSRRYTNEMIRILVDEALDARDRQRGGA